MELVHFRHADGKVETLRPTHALLVAERLGARIETDEDGSHVHAGSLAEATRQVRDGYRCRTVRKELRRVGLLGVEGVADRARIQITCADTEVLAAMREKSETN